jgi:hypothetical protein
MTMAFLNKLINNDVAAFVLKHALIGFCRATGRSRHPVDKKGLNIQCVKLTKEHTKVVQMVTYWCNLRTNVLQQMGATAETVASINRNDANFLTALSTAIANQQNPKHPVDSWLFFNDDLKSTIFFELQHCDRGTTQMRSSTVICSDR